MRIARLAVVALAVVALVTGCGVDMSAGNSFEPGQAQPNPAASGEPARRWHP